HRPSSRADRSVVRHTRPLRAGDTTVLDNLPVTTLRRTSIDCAMTLPPLEALTVLDGALAQGLTIEVATAELRRLQGSSGTARARWCLEQADARTESAGETATRFALLRHGLHVSQLQIPVRTRRSRYRIDLGWPELKIGIEFDGKMKYTRRAGGDPAEVVFQEKRRQDDLERAGWVIIRVTWADLLRPAAFIAEVHRRLHERSRQPYAVCAPRSHAHPRRRTRAHTRQLASVTPVPTTPSPLLPGPERRAVVSSRTHTAPSPPPARRHAVGRSPHDRPSTMRRFDTP